MQSHFSTTQNIILKCHDWNSNLCLCYFITVNATGNIRNKTYEERERQAAGRRETNGQNEKEAVVQTLATE